MKSLPEKYRGQILLLWVMVFVLHGAKLNSDIIGIDTEDLIQYGNDFYSGWLNTGRQGLVLLKQIGGNLSYNPYFAGLLTLICFAVAATLLFMLWDSVAERQSKSGIAWLTGGLLLVSHPIITEQFYFTLQSAEICMAVSITVLAVYLTQLWECEVLAEDRFALGRKVWLPVCGILLLILAFSVYQSLVVVYIFLAVTVILLKGIKVLPKEGNYSIKVLLLRIIPYVAVFLPAFVINTIITNYFFSTSDYLNNQIQWGSVSIGENLRYIGGHVIKTLLGYESIYYSIGYGILVLAAFCTLLYSFVITKQKKGSCIVQMFFVLSALICPYLMTILLGGIPACRSQLVLPMATAFWAYLGVNMLEEEWKQKGVKWVNTFLTLLLIIGCVVGCLGQTKTTMLLYYTDQMRYEQDVATAREMMSRIDRLAANETVALVVVGNKPFEGNNICVEGEMIGVSFFDHDSQMEPLCYWSTKRVQGLLHILGADYEMAPLDRFESSIEYSRYMPSWPAEGSVVLYEGVTIVKLSDFE